MRGIVTAPKERHINSPGRKPGKVQESERVPKGRHRPAMTWVKICGITNLEDALVAVEAGADALGFVFHANSPRKIEPKQARAIREAMPEHIERVGVFVNSAESEMDAVAQEADLTAWQLHKDLSGSLLGDAMREGGWLSIQGPSSRGHNLYVSLPA